MFLFFLRFPVAEGITQNGLVGSSAETVAWSHAGGKLVGTALSHVPQEAASPSKNLKDTEGA